jgi:hypothetical protein
LEHSIAKSGLNRSVKILHLAAFLGMPIFTVLQGCKMKDFNGKKFLKKRGKPYQKD